MAVNLSRLASANTYDNAISNLAKRQTALSNLQENLTSGKKVVRASDEADMEKLAQAGAAEVVPEAFEASIMLASHALALIGVSMPVFWQGLLMILLFAVILRQPGSARFAPSMAAAVASAPSFGTSAMVAPVAGFRTAIFSGAEVHSPAMRHCSRSKALS